MKRICASSWTITKNHEEERPLGIRNSKWEISKPIGVGPEEIEFVLNSTELRCDPGTGSSENYNEEVDSVDGVEILGQLSNYELLKKHSAQWC